MMRFRPIGLMVASLLVACGGGSDGSSGPTPGPPGIAKAPTNSGDQQIDTVGHTLPLPLAVVVTKDGAPLAAASVTWTPQAGQLSTTSTITDANGRSEVVWTLDTVAVSQTVEARVAGNPTPVVFIATVRTDLPDSIFILAGDSQSVDVSLPLPAPLFVGVIDRYGNGIQNLPVSWSVSPAGTATVGPSLSFTDIGVASTTISVGGLAGTVQVLASAPVAHGSPVSFDVIIKPLPTAITIQVINSRFSPAVDTVAQNGTVDWVWGTGSAAHNIVSTGSPSFPSDPPDSTTFDAPHSYQFTFGSKGTYRYYCTDHGSPASGMHGSIVVR